MALVCAKKKERSAVHVSGDRGGLDKADHFAAHGHLLVK